jgi:hypothetical protein
MSKKIPTHDPQTGETNPYYKELTGEENPYSFPRWQEPHKEIEYMPDQKWHRYVSFIKSGVRIIGYLFIPFNLVIAASVLILSEIIGIIEELV